MIIDPSTNDANVKLTDEQVKQLDVFNGRMTNIMVEMKGATKAKEALINDCARLGIDKAHQQGLLDSIIAQLEEAQKKLSVISETHVEKSNLLETLNKEIADKTVLMTTKETELKNRETSVAKREQEVEQKESLLNDNIANHSEDKNDFNQKVDSLMKVLSTFNG